VLVEIVGGDVLKSLRLVFQFLDVESVHWQPLWSSIHLDIGRNPDLPHFDVICNVGYTLPRCQEDVAVLRRARTARNISVDCTG